MVQVNFSNYDTITVSLQTVADLRTFPANKILDGLHAIVTGQASVEDQQGGIFTWSPTSVAPDDNLSVIACSTLSTGRWIKTVRSGSLGGNTLAIGLFTNAFTQTIPTGTDLVQTSGHHITGVGPALYAAVGGNPGLPDAAQFRSANGRWFRIVMDRGVHIDAFGGVPDYVPATGTWTTDNTSALDAAQTALGACGGTVIMRGDYYIGQSISIKPSVILEGEGHVLGSQVPSDMMSRGTKIWHPGSVDIYLDNCSGLRRVSVWAAGLQFNLTSAQVAAWTGRGLTLGGNRTDQLLEDISIFGFEWACVPAVTSSAFDGSPGSVTYSRFYTKGLIAIDCLNGIRLHNLSDVSRISNIHCWPYVTVFSAAEANGLQLKRPGWAIYLTGLNDHTMINQCFNYGYKHSFHVDGGDNTTWVCCDADYPFQTTNDGSFGYQSSGTAAETRWIGCQAVQRDSGFITNSTTSLMATESVSSQAWECRANGHAISKGHAKINGGSTRSSVAGAVGIQTANDASVGCEFNMHHFANLSRATVNGSSVIPLRDCGGNTYANIPTNSRHMNKYAPRIASASGITLNGTDTAYVITGTVATGTIFSEGDYINQVVWFYVQDGMSFFVGGNVSTKTGANTAVAAGQVIGFLATSAGWKQV